MSRIEEKITSLSIEERATGEIAAGAGIGTDGTSFMFSVSENNWLGRGVQLSTTVNASAESLSGNFSINNPNFNYSGNTVFTSLNVSSTDMTDTSGYETKKTGFSLGTEFEQYQNIFFAPSIEASVEDIEVESSASAAIKKMAGNLKFLTVGQI